MQIGFRGGKQMVACIAVGEISCYRDCEMACLINEKRERAIYILNIGNGELRDCCCCDSNMYKMQVMQPDGTWQVSVIKGRWHRCEQRYECMPSSLRLLN